MSDIYFLQLIKGSELNTIRFYGYIEENNSIYMIVANSATNENKEIKLSDSETLSFINDNITLYLGKNIYNVLIELRREIALRQLL